MGSLLAAAVALPLLATHETPILGEPPPDASPPPGLAGGQSPEFAPQAGAPPPGPMPPGKPGGPPDWPSSSRLLDDVREIRPDLVERLLNLHEQDPDSFRTEVRKLLSTWRVLSILEQQNPERYRALIEMWKAKDEKFDEELRRESSQLRIPRPPWPFPGGGPDSGGPPGEPGFGGEPGAPGQPGPDRRGPRTPWHLTPMGQAESKIRDLQRQWHAAEAEGQERASLRARLREAIAEMADLRAKYYADRIAFLEKELERLKGLVERRAATREEIIDTQLEELLATPPPPADAQRPGWPPERTAEKRP